MNIFTSLMPGVRQLRTPLAVGSMWFVSLYLISSPNWQSLTGQHALLNSISEQVQEIPIIYVIGGLTFAAYIVGSVAQGMSSLFAKGVNGVATKIEKMVEADHHRITGAWRRYLSRRREAFSLREVLMDTVSRKYADAGVAPVAYLAFPFSVIDFQLESSALQLWHKAPDQYQESDRLRAESAFRAGISLPLLVIGVELAFFIVWWLAIGLGLVAAVLALQSRTLDRERRSLLANALYQGLVSNPTLDATVRILGELELPARMAMPEWYAATAVAMNRAGDIDASGGVVTTGALELSDEIDFESSRWKPAVDDLMERVEPIFEKNGDDEYLEYFRRQVADAQLRAEAALSRTDELGDDDRPDWAARRAWRGRS